MTFLNLRLLLTFFWPREHHARKRMQVLYGVIVFLIILHFILDREAKSEESFSNLKVDIPRDFQPVRITGREAFPMSGPFKIPKIIHQTWKSTSIPRQFSHWIQSWLRLHPDWEYFLWTDASARELIQEKYPKLLSVYDGYTEPIRRADALRYVVLYEFGGIYADMDMEALTSLEPLALKYSCFIGQEPYEHPILDSNFDQLLINAVMGCRPKHPFIGMLLNNLPPFSIMWNVLDSTGPHFMTWTYRQYVSMKPDTDGEMFIAPSEYFYPVIDPVKISFMKQKCNDVGSLSKLQLKACRNLKFKNLHQNRFDLKTIAFTNHHWIHTYLKVLSVRGEDSIDIIAPRVQIYSSQSV